MKLQVLTWTPSRFAKWKECPAKVKYEDLMKLCPVCFKGRVSGGFDGHPVVCDSCSKPQPERPALERGNVLDAALTAYVQGQRAPVDEAARHPAILALANKLRKTKDVFVQESIVLDSKWQRVSQFTKGAWARLKLDVLHITKKVAHVIDWKSGNIDKRTGQIREREEYHDSMRAYQMAVLAVYPQAEASATMAFLDAPPKLEQPFKSLPILKRKDLAEAQRAWEKKIELMMNDTVFAPRSGIYCTWCPFSKAKGGPCQF